MSTSYFKILSSQIKSILKYHNNRKVSYGYLRVYDFHLHLTQQSCEARKADTIFTEINLDIFVQQKPTQHCKAIILQLKINIFLKKENMERENIFL